MNVKPADFLFGIFDFLSFIVPGMILYVTMPDVFHFKMHDSINIQVNNPTSGVWLACFVISYILGHFIYHLCAVTFNPVYEEVYCRIKTKRHLHFFKAATERIQEQIPGHRNVKRIVDAYIKTEKPAVLPFLEKHEANAKLFRSLCGLSIYMCFYPGLSQEVKFIFIAMSILCFSQFATQSWKKQLLSYELFYILTRDQFKPGETNTSVTKTFSKKEIELPLHQ